MPIFDLELGVAKTDTFDSLYPILARELKFDGKLVQSRNGSTKEFLTFKTIIESPLHRCVGGYNRDVNIFFLLAEAMWIWIGKRDVATLKFFNERMGDYSDNGETFNAPYGYRLRYHGADANHINKEEPNYAVTVDQLLAIAKMLKNNHEDRRAVAQIWNADFDLAKNSKDIPCNDLLMFKIRDGKLNLTINNRSNDVHWGLPTNVFQFSFILEIMSELIGVQIGTQTHISDSLHVYLGEGGENEITERMLRDGDKNAGSLYQYVTPTRMRLFSPLDTDVEKNMQYIDKAFSRILNLVCKSDITFDGFKHFHSYVPMDGIYHPHAQGEVNPWLWCVTMLLLVYKGYAKNKRTDEARLLAMEQIAIIANISNKCYDFIVCEDFVVLAMNWFANRIKDKANNQPRIEPILFSAFGSEGSEYKLNDFIGKL